MTTVFLMYSILSRNKRFASVTLFCILTWFRNIKSVKREYCFSPTATVISVIIEAYHLTVRTSVNQVNLSSVNLCATAQDDNIQRKACVINNIQLRCDETFFLQHCRVDKVWFLFHISPCFFQSESKFLWVKAVVGGLQTYSKVSAFVRRNVEGVWFWRWER